MLAVIKHFADKPGAESLSVGCRPRKRTRKGLVCTIYCSTHCDKNCQKDTCSWTGMATLLTEADPPAISIRSSGSESHAPDQKAKYGTLTHLQRMVVHQRAATATTKAVHRAVQSLNPRKKVPAGLSSFVARVRKQWRKKEKVEDLPQKGTYEASDFEYLRDRLNASLGGSTILQPDDPRLRSDDSSLRCINLQMSPQSLCAPLICPKLLHLTLSLLPTPWKLKLSTEGTYRLLFDQYALLTVGVNVKNYSKRKSANLHTFRSSFLPLAFAVANVEDGEAYTHFLQTCLEVAQTVGLRLEAKHILQFHGDLHKGIEKARVAVFPQSHRLSDWAHVTGVTSQGPNGLHGFLSQSLGDNTELSRFTLQWCRISKHMTLHLFHEIWTQIFCRLEDCGHGAMNVENNEKTIFSPGDSS